MTCHCKRFRVFMPHTHATEITSVTSLRNYWDISRLVNDCEYSVASRSRDNQSVLANANKPTPTVHDSYLKLCTVIKSEVFCTIFATSGQVLLWRSSRCARKRQRNQNFSSHPQLVKTFTYFGKELATRTILRRTVTTLCSCCPLLC